MCSIAQGFLSGHGGGVFWDHAGAGEDEKEVNHRWYMGKIPMSSHS